MSASTSSRASASSTTWSPTRTRTSSRCGRVVGYDVLFKGDDWKGTEKGRLLEEKLAAVGARMHYFPYTEHTSSTLLREVLLGMRQPGEPATEPSA